jgi:hypothetical protein
VYYYNGFWILSQEPVIKRRRIVTRFTYNSSDLNECSYGFQITTSMCRDKYSGLAHKEYDWVTLRDLAKAEKGSGTDSRLQSALAATCLQTKVHTHLTLRSPGVGAVNVKLGRLRSVLDVRVVYARPSSYVARLAELLIDFLPFTDSRISVMKRTLRVPLVYVARQLATMHMPVTGLGM